MSVGRRFVSRFNPGKPAWLEEVIQPLYHRVTSAATFARITFFANLAAGLTQLDITPQLSASNGQIPDPKIFVVHGIRKVYAEDNGTLADRLVDLTTLLWNTFTTFHVGERDYLVCPEWYLPSGGIGVKFMNEGAAAERLIAQNGGGGYFDRFSLMRVPITIPSRQLFFLTQEPSGTVTTTATRRIWTVLDGALGREL